MVKIIVSFPTVLTSLGFLPYAFVTMVEDNDLLYTLIGYKADSIIIGLESSLQRLLSCCDI